MFTLTIVILEQSLKDKSTRRHDLPSAFYHYDISCYYKKLSYVHDSFCK